MICPYCKGKMTYIEDRNYWVCPFDLGEFWPGEKPERGEYKKKEEISILSPELMLWHEADMNYKPPLPPGVPIFKGGGKNGRKRKKKPKIQISNVNYL